ncbi:MAG: anaerobic sulfatase maturase [Bryobacteraceae bacterium]|nr:anaerobic sulfatase maturase [Bryobacteraceae bacterium]
MPLSTLAADPFRVIGSVPRIGSLLVKPASALCNLDCSYCFYLDRATDPYAGLQTRRMTADTQERLVAGFLEYSYPNSTFAFQGGEPTLCGLPWFERLVDLQVSHGRSGQQVSNAMQTNGMLIDEDWCSLFRSYNWLVGVSMDGPEAIHDQYRRNRGGAPTWRRVMQSIELMKKTKVEFNVLCVLSAANIDKPREIYRFFRSIGVDNLQFIPLVEFGAGGERQPYSVTPEQYGKFLTAVFDLWWPHRKSMRIRVFDNLAEAVAGQMPGSCCLQASCDSYAVVEYNGDVYPCDFFVEGSWKLGNVAEESFAAIAKRRARMEFASKKAIPHPKCDACEYEEICQRGCPHTRRAQRGEFGDLDYFCESYKALYAKALRPLEVEVRHLMSRR